MIVRDRQNDAGPDRGFQRQAGPHQPSGMDQHPGRGAFVKTVTLEIAGSLGDGDEGSGKADIGSGLARHDGRLDGRRRIAEIDREETLLGGFL